MLNRGNEGQQERKDPFLAESYWVKTQQALATRGTVLMKCAFVTELLKIYLTLIKLIEVNQSVIIYTQLLG